MLALDGGCLVVAGCTDLGVLLDDGHAACAMRLLSVGPEEVIFGIGLGIRRRSATI